MKVLITMQPAYGHFHPLVPLARALGDAGHEVRFGCAPSFGATVTAATGLRAEPLGLDWLVATAATQFPELLTSQPKDVFPRIFTRVTAQQTADAILTMTWRPDIIVHEYYEFGGYLAAEKLGIPHVRVGIAPFVPGLRNVGGDVGLRNLNELRALYELPRDPALASLYRYAYLHYFPTRYQPVTPAIPTMHALRPPIFDLETASGVPTWLDGLPPQPTVYATLGTVFNRHPQLIDAILAALAPEAVNLIVTVGNNQDPAQFGTQPAHIHVERYIPQTMLFPRCALAITHGGYNTVMTALSYGVPQVIIPITADQPFHAQRCVELGVARSLAPADATPKAIRHAVTAMLRDASYFALAHQLRAEIAAMPDETQAVRIIERCAQSPGAATPPRQTGQHWLKRIFTGGTKPR